MQRTITRQMSFDLTKLLVTEDWFSDISPQTMRRLLNIVSITGLILFLQNLDEKKQRKLKCLIEYKII